MDSEDSHPAPRSLPDAAPRSNAGAGFRWQPPSPEHMAQLLPQYDRWETLGHGGMGAVYKARQINLDRMVAIKILPPDVIDDGAQFIERFKNEARAMARLMHPAIVAVFDSGETADGQLYFVMEFVEGTDVQRMIKAGGRLPQEHALAITAHVCDALEYAHKRGIIHRDIKPANILIDQEGHVKVADFGLAKVLDPSLTHGLTRSNMAMGTPDFVAPEGLLPGRTADHRADLYAVGVMLYQMLTGELPRGMFKLPSQKKIGSDPRFDGIIHRAMEQEPEDRYQSAIELRRELDAIRATPRAREEGTGVVPASFLAQESSADAPTVPSLPRVSMAPAPPAKESSVGRRLLRIGSAAVALAGVGGFFWWNESKKPADSSKPETSSPSARGITGAEKVDVSPDGVTAVSGGPPKSANTIDCLKTLSWEAPWIFEKGTLKSVKDASRYLGEGKDGVVRVRFRLNPSAGPISTTAPPLQLAIRGSTAQGAEHGAYQLQVFPTARLMHLFYMKVGSDGKIRPYATLWENKPFPVGAGAGEEIEMEFRAVGDELSAWVDGRMTASIHDSRLQSGSWVVNASPGAEILALEMSDVSRAAPNITNWQDVTAAVRATARSIPALAVDSAGVRRTGEGDPVDVAITGRKLQDFALRFRHTGTVQVKLRSRASGGLYVIAQDSQMIFDHWRPSAPAPEKLARPKHDIDLSPGKQHEFLLVAEGTSIRAWMDGQFIGEAVDTEPRDGDTQITMFRQTLLHSVELVDLSESAATPLPSSPPPPHVANWQDVSATFREEARKLAGALIEQDSVRLSEGSTPQRIMLTPPGMKDFAIHVRFTGGTQIDRVKSNEEFDFVICQKMQVGFQLLEKGKTQASNLIPGIVHPKDYDFNQPHELLVTAEGPQLRAWLDGHFVGEARDDIVQEGRGALMLKSYTSIHSVKIAELTEDASAAIAELNAAPSAAAGQWRAILTKPEDFGSHAKEVEFRDGGVFFKGPTILAPAVSAEGGIRATLRYFETDRTGSLTIRSPDGARYGNESHACTAYISAKGASVVVQQRDKAAGIVEPQRDDFPISPAIKEGETFTFELRASNGRIIVSVNGHEVGSLKDQWAGGNRRFGITPSNTEITEFRNVEWQAMGGTP